MIETNRHIDIEGTSLWTVTSGSGPPMLLCHGGPGLWDDLSDVAETVSDLLTVHRYDQRGCGRSTGHGPYTITQSVADMEALRGAFGYERWIVGGHSWGASLALHYALAHPERVRALVLIAGIPIWCGFRAAYDAERIRRLGDDAGRYAELKARERTPEEERERVILSWATDFADRVTAKEYAAHLLRDPALTPNYECNAQINAETHALDEAALLERYRGLDVPVLIVHGTEDPRPHSSGDVLLETLPDARRTILDGAGHFPWVETADAFRGAMRAFVEEVLSAK